MTSFLVHPAIRFTVLLTVLGLVVIGALDVAGIKHRISNVVFETYIKIKPRPASDKLVFVDIDDESLTKAGQWPWPRTMVAQMVRNIKDAGAKVIIFDGVLAEPDRTSPENLARILPEENPARPLLLQQQSHDQKLAEAIRETGNFVAGFTFGSNPEPPLIKRRILAKAPFRSFFTSQKDYKSGYFETTAQFLPVLEKSAAGNGSFMASAGGDGVIRRTGLLFHDGQKIYPSLIFEGLRLFEGEGKSYIRISETPGYNNFQIAEPFTAKIGSYDIPVGPDGKMWVYFRPFENKNNISAYRFLDRNFQPAEMDLTGKAVFIASSAEGLMDLRATPLGMQPGVRIHMNAFEQILQGEYLIRPYTANLLEIGAAAGVALLLILLSFFVNPIWLAGITIAVAGGAFWSSWHFFSAYGGLFDPVTPTIMTGLVFVAASLLNFLKSEADRKQVRDAFGLYISPDFMAELTKDPDKLSLGGEIRDLTVLFSDIRSFTSISEGLTPQELIQLMNDFLTPMSDLVMDNRGTIDKYMGDAMMAFWNAPLDDPDHARHACIAALGMQAALAPINEGVRKKAEEIGKEPVLLQAGIGINSGPCAVGNMGSRQRFAYSTLGDAVNLASRLEGQTKTYGVGILIGESTYNAVPDFAALEMDLIQVKGKTEPVRVFALFGDAEMAATQGFKDWKLQHDAMLEAYRAADFEKAITMAKKAREVALVNLDVGYDLYLERCAALIKTPPPEGWDGVFIATSK